MITFILIGLVAILAIGLGVMVWNNGARKRSDQAQVTSANSASGETKIGRETGRAATQCLIAHMIQLPTITAPMKRTKQ